MLHCKVGDYAPDCLAVFILDHFIYAVELMNVLEGVCD